MNEVMNILKDSGIIDDFVKSNNDAIRSVHEKTGDKKWKPDDFVVELAARLHLECKLSEKNEELLNAFAEFANEIAIRELAKELVKIANANMEVE